MSNGIDSLGRRKLRIIVVEDHHIMRRGLASLLRTEINAEIVGEAQDGLDALELLQNTQADVLIMDIAMPRMNGIEATRRIKQKHPGLFILILSMYNNPRLVNQALQAGASGYILKESLVEELTQALQTAINGGIFISSLVEGSILEAFPTAMPHEGYEMKPDGRSVEALTRREYEVLRLLADGKTVAQIATELCVSIYTVYTHKSNIKQKLGLSNTAEIIRFAFEQYHTLPGEGV